MKDVQTAIIDLTWPVTNAKGQKLRDQPPAQKIKPKVGVGKPTASGAKGAVSDLTEENASLREYWASRVVYTTDGVFTVAVEPVKKIIFKNNDGAVVNMLLADPPA